MYTENRYSAQRYPMQFTGTGSEYFRIWIVNIAFTLLTLGIYSAWAKVRTKHWFYGHTLLDNQRFAYHAKPLQILKGRIIALVFFGGYSLSARYSPATAFPIMAILLFTAMPWIIVTSLKFNAHNSSYRGIRFGFTGRVGEAITYYMWLPLLVVFTAGLAYPYMVYRQTQFITSHYQYGQTSVQFNSTAKPFWIIYMVGLILPIISLIIGMILALHLAPSVNGISKIEYQGIGVFCFYLFLPLFGSYIGSRTANLIYNNSHLGSVSFESSQRARDLIWLYVSNFILIVITWGLFIPWAKVRMMKYRANHLQLHSTERLENFTAGVSEAVAATGVEMADTFGLDIALV
ncbi:MAG: DUF898 domain-containing protein [Methylococcaceae bacterium]|nr:DUF898 domain-containing protein [Methylococcaceae bacterium]